MILPREHITEEPEHHRPKCGKQYSDYPKSRLCVLEPEQEPKQKDCDYQMPL